MSYNIGDEVRITATGKYGIITDDSDNKNGLYTIKLEDDDTEDIYHVSEFE